MLILFRMNMEGYETIENWIKEKFVPWFEEPFPKPTSDNMDITVG